MSVIRALHQHFIGRVATALALLVATMPIYWWLNDHLEPRVDFMTPLDAAIPFVPCTFAVYMSFFLLLLVAAWRADADTFSRALASVLMANAICYATFVIVPAHYPRPSIGELGRGFWSDALARIFAADRPGNTFPSVHVSTTVVIALSLRRDRAATVWLLWAALICLSTLTVKQHFIADVIGGIVVGTVAYAVFQREPRRELRSVKSQ